MACQNTTFFKVTNFVQFYSLPFLGIPFPFCFAHFFAPIAFFLVHAMCLCHLRLDDIDDFDASYVVTGKLRNIITPLS